MRFVNRQNKKIKNFLESVDHVGSVDQFLQLAGQVRSRAGGGGVHAVPGQVLPLDELAQPVAAGNIRHQGDERCKGRARNRPLRRAAAVGSLDCHGAAVCLPVAIRPGHVAFMYILANLGLRDAIVRGTFPPHALPKRAQGINGHHTGAMVDGNFREHTALRCAVLGVIALVCGNEPGNQIGIRHGRNVPLVTA